MWPEPCRVMCAIACVERVDDGDGQDLVEVFRVPVARLRRDHPRDERPAGVVAAELDARLPRARRPRGRNAAAASR